MKNANITTIRIYNLVNAKGIGLQLKLGIIKGAERVPNGLRGDSGYRWSFKGTQIPMPVRNDTWFNGFPEETMLDWLKANGWCLRTIVYSNGEAQVFDLPEAEEQPKANEEHEYRDIYQYVFHDVIKDMCIHYRKADATRLYRYVHGGSLHHAVKAVNEIWDE